MQYIVSFLVLQSPWWKVESKLISCSRLCLGDVNKIYDENTLIDRNNAKQWDVQQCSMCDKQRLRSACAYAQSDQNLCYSREYTMSVSFSCIPDVLWLIVLCGSSTRRNYLDGNISIHHECEGGIIKSVPRITDWHHEACRMMTIGDLEGRIFLLPPSHSWWIPFLAHR